MKKILIFGMLAIINIGHSQGLLSGLQACYPLDCDSATNFAITGSSLNGVISNLTCTIGHSGAPNTAYAFSGMASSHISLPASNLLKSQAICVSGWYLVNNINSNPYLVFTKNSCSGPQEAYALGIDGGKFVVEKTGVNCSRDLLYSLSSVTSGYHHVVFYIDNSIMEIYVDGNYANKTTTIMWDYVPSKGVILGGSQENIESPFQGKMDNLRFYNRRLTLQEVTLLFESDPTCTSTGTITNPPSESCCLGNYCSSSSPNSLTGNYEIPLNSFDFNFSGDTRLKDKVNIGYSCGSQTVGKLNVFTGQQSNSGTILFKAPSIGIYANNASSSDGMAILGEASNVGSTGIPIGIRGMASNGVGLNIGISGIGGKLATNGTSYGGDFSSVFAGNFSNTGATFFAKGATSSNIGIRTAAYPSTGNSPAFPVWLNYYSNINIALHAICEPNNSNTFPPGPDWAGWFDGDVFINGQGYYTNFGIIVSDRKFKKDIKAIENASSIIGKLKPSNYFLKTDNEYGLGFSDKKQFGFISQDVEEILPELVQNVYKPEATDDKGNVIHKGTEIKGLNYVGFIALLTKGMQEQQLKIESQQQQLDELKALMGSSSTNSQKPAVYESSLNITLADKSSIVLNQNVPNPFAENTVITYNIPTDFSKAEIIFTTNDGIIVKKISITEKGIGTLNVFANDLSHGVYTYTLVVDGKSIDSKKMIKE